VPLRAADIAMPRFVAFLRGVMPTNDDFDSSSLRGRRGNDPHQIFERSKYSDKITLALMGKRAGTTPH
jgi:hypothetical protein